MTSDKKARSRSDAEELGNHQIEVLEKRIRVQTEEIRLQAEAIARLAEGVMITEGSNWLESQITFVNDAVTHITGYSADELVGQSRRILDGVATAPETLDRIQSQLSAGHSCKAELVHYRKDGSPYHAELSITPFEGVGDGNGRFVTIHRDVTQQKMAEQALSASAERMRTILDTALDSIITFDTRGVIVEANRATGRMFGYAPEELVGQNVDILIQSPHREQHNDDIARYVETGRAQNIGTKRAIVGIHKDGSTFPVELSIAAMENLGLFTGVYRDISVRKQTERALERYRKDLQIVSSELMLAEERERQRLAQDLHDGLGQTLFRARMKLDEFSADDPAVAEIGAMLEEVGRMVNTLTFELSPPVLRLLGLRAAITWLARDMKQRYALCVEVIDDEQEYALDERVALVVFRSVRELLINVAKHAETDRASVDLRRLGMTLQIEIKDSGKGFKPVERTRQIESGHFGLFSIRERLEYLGGSLEIQSAPAEGARLTLTVPLSKAPARQS